MAPGLNGCQSGNAAKNKAKSQNRAARDFFDTTNSWEVGSDRRRNTGSSYSGTDPDSRPSRTTGNLVDNDNGELSWGLNQVPGESPGLSSRSLLRGARFWMSSDQPPSSGSQPPAGSGSSGRNNAPNRYQVINKLACIQDYIEQTEAIMRELRSSDTPGCKEQHDKLGTMLADLRDSEKKLQTLLRGMDQVDAKIDRLLNQPSQNAHMNGDGPTEDELHRRTEEHNKKVDALEKQRQELVELQQLAQRKLADAEAERSRLLARATSINTDAIAGTSLEANLQSLTDRLRNVERVCEDQNRLSVAMDRAEPPPEIQEDDQVEAELSDTETDYQLVRDKVAELNAMKAQLAQLQSMMAAIETDQDGSETGSRRSQPRDLQKIERAVNQIEDLNRLVESVRNLGVKEEQEEPEDNDEGSPQREREAAAVEAMQQMTRDLEEQTAKMKRERDCLIQARKDLQKIARLANRPGGSSPEDSESEPPSLLPASSNSRNLPDDDLGSRSGGRKSNESAGMRAPPRGARPRTSWNQSLPTLHNIGQETLDRRRKDPLSSQSSVRNARIGGGSSNWSHEALNADSLYQTQNQLEESAQLCEQMLQDAVGGRPQAGTNPDLTGILYSHQQMLTKTVSHCCTLIWLQQRQINELRNALILQQSSSVSNQQPSGPSQGAQFPCGYPSVFPRDFAAASRIQKPPEPGASYYYQEDAARPVPPSNPSNQGFPPFPADLQYLNPRLNANQFSPRSGNPDLMINNQLPPLVPVMACFSPEELGPSGALNNQVPPGNRANNYWDNFRSYSRQNLLSTTKSNENSDTLRRNGGRQRGNQEPTPHAVVTPNNRSHNPVLEVQPLRRGTRPTVYASPIPHPSNHSSSDRAGSAEPQPRSRNNTSTAHNRTRPVPWASLRENQDGSYTRVRNDTGNGLRNRSESNFAEMPAETSERPNNSSQTWHPNNRTDANNSIFTVLRLPTSVYQEVANFIHANEARPNFLIQLFRDLQQVTSDPQRQRALQSLQEVVGLNNAAQEPRNNILHENRSNLNRNWDEAAALDELFDHLRENQNTIRQNIVATAPPESSGNNLENPNISNIRELSGAAATNPRNNFDHNRMRDLQSYFEGNFCSGPGSSLKNPNLSNIRENLTEGVPREQRNPKNLYDNLLEDWRRSGHVRRYNVPYSGMFFMDDSFGYDRMTSRRLVPEIDPWGNEFNNAARETHANGIERGASPEWENPWGMGRMMFNSVNTDLAEADQTTEQMGPFLTRMATIPDVDIEAMMQERCGEPHAVAEQLEEEVGHPLEADSNENLGSSESNNNVSKSPAAVKNRRDASSESIVKKVSKTRLEEAFSAAADGDWSENAAPVADVEVSPPMMDMAGALEHLIDYRPPETNSFAAPDDVWDAEREAWLDQVPTRLETREAEDAEKDEPK